MIVCCHKLNLFLRRLSDVQFIFGLLTSTLSPLPSPLSPPPCPISAPPFLSSQFLSSLSRPLCPSPSPYSVFSCRLLFFFFSFFRPSSLISSPSALHPKARRDNISWHPSLQKLFACLSVEDRECLSCCCLSCICLSCSFAALADAPLAVASLASASLALLPLLLLHMSYILEIKKNRILSFSSCCVSNPIPA